MMGKRVFDLVFSTLGLMLLSPFFFTVALWIKWNSPGPVFFRQHRVGKGEKPFRIFKFRTMVTDAENRGGKITYSGDPRITSAGQFLRRFKLDELPQLINVVKGEMSLVGPRPEVPEYVAHYPPPDREKVLSVPPGITDNASLEFRDENELLAGKTDVDRVYREEILPIKLDYYIKYVENRSFGEDLRVIMKTIVAIFR